MTNISVFSANIMPMNLLTSVPVKWILLTILTFYIFNSHFRQPLKILRLMFRLPGPPGHPIFGQVVWLIDPKRFNELRHTFRKLYGPVIRIWTVFFPMVLITDPKDIQKVLASSKHLQKPFHYSFFKNLLGEGLLTSEVTIWKNHRKMLQPYFHMRYIEEYLPVINKGSQLLIQALEQHLKATSNINITSLVNKSVICILSESVLGLDFDPKTAFEDVESSPYRESSNKFIDRLYKPLLGLDFIYKRTRQAQKETSTFNLRMGFTRKLIKERREMRKKGSFKSKCFLDFLLDVSENENFTEEECITEACTFMLAGQDSVGATLAFCLHQIANNAEVQGNINNELELIFGEDFERSATVLDVRKMIYLEQCIKETMRLYPAVPVIVRRLGEDVKTETYEIPKGCSVVILPWLTHFLDEFYPDPEVFNPDRFELTECEKRHPYAFIPFSAGPRNCIGYKFAMVEMKTIIANILRKYWLTPVLGKEKLHATCKVTTRASGGVWLTLTDKEKQRKI